MAVQQTLERLRLMRLPGMVQAYLRDSQTEGIAELSFEERLALMVDHEWALRESNRIARLRKKARFRIDAMPEDIDYQHPWPKRSRLRSASLRLIRRATMCSSLVQQAWANLSGMCFGQCRRRLGVRLDTTVPTLHGGSRCTRRWTVF